MLIGAKKKDGKQGYKNTLFNCLGAFKNSGQGCMKGKNNPEKQPDENG